MRLPWMLLAVLFAAPPPSEDRLWQHRNRGKAFYENPTTQQEAVNEFQKALQLNPTSARERLNYALALLRAGKTDEALAELERVRKQDPQLPHTWFNLGIAFKKAGETEQAVTMFERMVALAPEDAVSHYNLGVLYKLQGKQDEAIERFRLAARYGPHLAAPQFQLYNAMRLAGNREEAAKALAAFQDRKKAAEASGITEDMEWNDFAEIYDPIEPSTAVAATPPARLQWRPRKVGAGLRDARALLTNVDGDARPDVIVWNGTATVLYRNGITAEQLPPANVVAAGDVNNDGRADLCLLHADTAELLINKQRTPLTKGSFTHALFVDFDHDYDLDILLLGSKPVLMRNQGEAGFAEHTKAFPFQPGTPVDAAVLRVTPDSKAHDIVITYADKTSVLYRDRLAGRYDPTPLPQLPQGATRLVVEDWNHDSRPDLTFEHQQQWHLLANTPRGWEAGSQPVPPNGFFCDFTNRGVFDLCRREGPLAGVVAVADFTGDGRPDAFTIDATAATLQTNVTPVTNRWLSMNLNGIKNLKLAHHAEVEVRAGSSYQKRIYRGFPLTFGLGAATQSDTVRITWPNGLIQNEANQPTGKALVYKEAQRLSGSCPMIFTWDGRQFTFLTDALGVAPLGASSGDGEYFPTDHDEYIWIPGDALRDRDGLLDIRITEELGEVTYLDKLRLIAVDHPRSLELYSNDKWKSPPYPEFRLFGTTKRIQPIRATDHKGVDVTERVLQRDRNYADTFARTRRNTAETHSLTLDFTGAPSAGTFLVLHGWVDWADGSTFLERSQAHNAALFPPYLQMRDAQGRWQTVIEDMGIPSGKTKTIAVDLSGKWLSSSRELRIVTNLCVFWDEVFLGVENGKPEYRLTDLTTVSAELDYHGFSLPQIHPERRQPENFLYHTTTVQAPWNPTPGLYTRYGDVAPLLTDADDQYAILGSGDEIRLRYDATSAPPLPQGWTRDYLLYFDGWAKDADANTAYSQTVEPLPFHGMSRYPYPATERFPDTPAHRQWRERYNTRPALRWLRPLTSSTR